MDISSDDDDFILANLELFELQPIWSSSVGEYEQMQRNLQADNPTLAPQIDSRKPANQEILQPVPGRSIQQTTLALLLKIMCSLLLILPNSLMKVQPACQNQKDSNQWMKQNLRTFKTITTNRMPLNKTHDGEFNYSKVCYILHFAHTNKNTMVTQFCMILIWIFVHQNRNKWVIFS